MPATALTFAAPTNSSPTVTPQATDPTNGNSIAITDTSKDLMLQFRNGHSSSITVTIEGQSHTKTYSGMGSGTFTKADVAAAIAAGATAVFVIPASEIAAYMDADSKVQITYIGGNAALTVVPLKT